MYTNTPATKFNMIISTGDSMMKSRFFCKNVCCPNIPKKSVILKNGNSAAIYNRLY